MVNDAIANHVYETEGSPNRLLARHRRAFFRILWCSPGSPVEVQTVTVTNLIQVVFTL